MLDTAAKNLWLLLTLILPGFFTYGLLRIVLLFVTSTNLNLRLLDVIDHSSLVTGAVIIAIALLQQAVGMAIEALLTVLAKIQRKRWPDFHSLFCERFELAAVGRMDEQSTRIVGNFFLSVNMSVGLVTVLSYFHFYENTDETPWIVPVLSLLLLAALIASVLRMFNAKWALVASRDAALAKQLQEQESSN